MTRLKTVLCNALACLSILQCQSINACGWWGDGEMNRDSHNEFSVLVEPVSSVPLSYSNSKIPGEIGYGIAVPHPRKAMPYLELVGNRQVNRINELKSFGFKAVIDLGTEEKTANLHRLETEAIDMRYWSIPVQGLVPTEEQVFRFMEYVLNANRNLLLVYAPDSELLGSMWAAYRFKMGAPIEFAINEGKSLGMKEEQAIQLRKLLDD